MLPTSIFSSRKLADTGVVADAVARLRRCLEGHLQTSQALAGLRWSALVSLADVSLEILVILKQGLPVDDHTGHVPVRRLESVGLVRVLELELVAMLAFVAFCYGLGVEAQLLEAGLPVLVLPLHHQVLHAVDEAEMHIQIRPGVDGASFHGVEQTLVRTMLQQQTSHQLSNASINQQLRLLLQD